MGIDLIVPAHLDLLHLAFLAAVMSQTWVILRKRNEVAPKAENAESPATQSPAPKNSEASEASKSGLLDPMQQEQAALVLLSSLQKHGRFLDFVSEDIDQAADADIGVAARVVHAGCQKVVKDYFELKPLHASEEDSRVEVPEGFDPQEILVTGQVAGQPPYQGRLLHRGWQVTTTRLPSLNQGARADVLMPAEVEV